MIIAYRVTTISMSSRATSVLSSSHDLGRSDVRRVLWKLRDLRASHSEIFSLS